MLINLSNHPSDKWTGEQRRNAVSLYREIRDIAFPDVLPSLRIEEVDALAVKYVHACVELLASLNDPRPHAIHVMGEMTFVHRFVLHAAAGGILCVAAVSTRCIDREADGRKTVTFRFSGFRSYHTSREIPCASA